MDSLISHAIVKIKIRDNPTDFSMAVDIHVQPLGEHDTGALSSSRLERKWDLVPEKRSIKKQTQVFLNCLSTAPLGLFINYVSSIGEVLSDLYINLTGKINKKTTIWYLRVDRFWDDLVYGQPFLVQLQRIYVRGH